MTDKTYVIWWCLYINSRNATSQCILKTLTAKFGSWGISAFIDEKPRVWFILTFKRVMHDSEQTFSSQMLIFAYISQMIRCLQLDINWRTMDLTGKIMLLCMLHQWSKRQDWKSPRWAWGEQVLGDRKDICLVKSWMLVCWWWWFDWSFVHLSSPTVTTTSIILRRLAHVHGTNFHHHFVASILLLLSNVNLRHLYIITLLIHIVRRPCCVSALTSP